MHKNGKQIEKCKMLLIKQEISHSANKHLFLNDKHNTRNTFGIASMDAIETYFFTFTASVVSII